MATFSKVLLSDSTDGRMIEIATTGTPGTAIHTAIASTATLDEVWLWAVNSDTAARKVTIEFGGVSSPDDLIEVTVPAEDGLMQLVPGLILKNSLLVKAFAETTGVVMVGGYINRIT